MMGNIRLTFTFLLFLFAFINVNGAARQQSQLNNSVSTIEVNEKSHQKWDKKLERLQKKLDRKLQKRNDEDSKPFWNKLSFLLGVLFIIGGILLGISIFFNPIGGFFYFLAGLLVTSGIVLIMFAASNA